VESFPHRESRLATIVLTALATGVIALNLWYRRHRSYLTKLQAERGNLEKEAECAIG
jgi:hypothetical protein